MRNALARTPKTLKPSLARLASTAASPRLVSARASSTTREAEISFCDGSTFRFHALWLRDSCRDEAHVEKQTERVLSASPIVSRLSLDVGAHGSRTSWGGGLAVLAAPCLATPRRASSAGGASPQHAAVHGGAPHPVPGPRPTYTRRDRVPALLPVRPRPSAGIKELTLDEDSQTLRVAWNNGTVDESTFEAGFSARSPPRGKASRGRGGHREGCFGWFEFLNLEGRHAVRPAELRLWDASAPIITRVKYSGSPAASRATSSSDRSSTPASSSCPPPLQPTPHSPRPPHTHTPRARTSLASHIAASANAAPRSAVARWRGCRATSWRLEPRQVRHESTSAGCRSTRGACPTGPLDRGDGDPLEHDRDARRNNAYDTSKQLCNHTDQACTTPGLLLMFHAHGEGNNSLTDGFVGYALRERHQALRDARAVRHAPTRPSSAPKTQGPRETPADPASKPPANPGHAPANPHSALNPDPNAAAVPGTA